MNSYYLDTAISLALNQEREHYQIPNLPSTPLPILIRLPWQGYFHPDC